MLFQPQMKMADIIHTDYHLLLIISRFGIKLGFGDKSIRQVCTENGIDTDFFLVIINSYYQKNYFPSKHLQSFSLEQIVDYLRKAHTYYLKDKVPEVSELLNKLNTCAGAGDQKSLSLINKFFNEYCTELRTHIQREEDHVYPYIFDVEKAFLSGRSDIDIVNRISQYSIDDYEKEHDNVEDKLLDLKNILIKYLQVPMDPSLGKLILFELFRLETDLRDHARIEDKILVPKVRYMEKWLVENFTGSNVHIGAEKQYAKRPAASNNLKPPEDLSKREKEVLKLVALGMTNKEIAEKLFISLHTVITHRKNITSKLGIKTIAGLTVYAVLNQLITTEDIS